MKLKKYKKEIDEFSEKTKDLPEDKKYEIAKSMLEKLEQIPETKISRLAKKYLNEYIEKYEKENKS
jgi:t-SNARE complex subunit (syntaxin)